MQQVKPKLSQAQCINYWPARFYFCNAWAPESQLSVILLHTRDEHNEMWSKRASFKYAHSKPHSTYTKVPLINVKKLFEQPISVGLSLPQLGFAKADCDSIHRACYRRDHQRPWVNAHYNTIQTATCKSRILWTLYHTTLHKDNSRNVFDMYR